MTTQKEIVSNGPGANNPEGQILFRNEGRAYWSYETRVENFWELNAAYRNWLATSKENGRRRTVLRVRCSQEVVDRLLESDLPREVIVPLNTIWPESTDYLVVLGENVHPSEVPEWSEVYNYWQHPNGSHKRPMDRITNATQNEGFQITNVLTLDDVPQLQEIWRPFGWSEQAVISFVNTYRDNPKLWFSGVRDPRTGQLVSACEAELANLAGISLVEGTEYGTLPGYEGMGLCTAAVTALHAQVLRDTFYQTGVAPLIMAEFNMTSRSDVVGRHAGITIPLVENTPGLDNTPIQVLRMNVPVLDRLTPNNISYRGLGDKKDHYRDAYRHTYHRYWRNFIVGTLPLSSIEANYSAEQVETILSTLNQERI